MNLQSIEGVLITELKEQTEHKDDSESEQNRAFLKWNFGAPFNSYRYLKVYYMKKEEKTFLL